MSRENPDYVVAGLGGIDRGRGETVEGFVADADGDRCLIYHPNGTVNEPWEHVADLVAGRQPYDGVIDAIAALGSSAAEREALAAILAPVFANL